MGLERKRFSFDPRWWNVNPDNHRHLARHGSPSLVSLATAQRVAEQQQHQTLCLLAPVRTSEIFFSLEFSSIPPYCDFQQQDRFTMVKVWFPSMFMRLVNHNLAKQKATLQVPPSMTKHEVKEYLSKIYNIEATKVSTMNVAGKITV